MTEAPAIPNPIDMERGGGRRLWQEENALGAIREIEGETGGSRHHGEQLEKYIQLRRAEKRSPEEEEAFRNVSYYLSEYFGDNQTSVIDAYVRAEGVRNDSQQQQTPTS